MRKEPIARRHFLRGISGLLVAIPFLDSLGPKSVKAAPTVRKRFISFATEHGGVWPSRLHPNKETVKEKLVYGNHEVRRGDLTLSTSGGTSSLSTVLSASSSVFTSKLASKMNVLRGFDIPW